MSARGTITGALASAAIVVVAWQLGQSSAATTRASSSTSTTTGASSSGASSSGSSGTSSGASTSVNGTFTGSVIQTRFGNMQVEIVVASGTITDVKVLQSTNREQRSVQISAEADPILRSEVLQAQSANVQMVSGATYTSEGYLQSLQAALDTAGL